MPRATNGPATLARRKKFSKKPKAILEINHASFAMLKKLSIALNALRIAIAVRRSLSFARYGLCGSMRSAARMVLITAVLCMA